MHAVAGGHLECVNEMLKMEKRIVAQKKNDLKIEVMYNNLVFIPPTEIGIRAKNGWTALRYVLYKNDPNRSDTVERMRIAEALWEFP